MSEQVEVLERSSAIPKNIDPMGREWKIKNVRGSSLLKAEPEPFRKDFACPKLMQGLWSGKFRLQEQITLYLKRAWDDSDAAAQKKARMEQAVKEENARIAKELAAKTKAKKKQQEVVAKRQKAKADARAKDK